MTQVSRDTPGSVNARGREQRKIPAKGKVYLLTSAQNNTGVHTALWRNLLAYAEHRKAEILVGSFTYHKPKHEASAKRKTAKETPEPVEWWADEVLPYLADRSIQLAPNLVWCGELQILPTAVRPLSGLESYTGRDSSVIPHVKFALQSVPGPKKGGTKMVYTTGTVTKRNYIQKKAGQKAEFHHGYGALIVEVLPNGEWFARQINADSKGEFYDLTTKVADGRVTGGHRPEVLVWGDVHTRHLEGSMRTLAWGKGGILDVLRPKRQVFHDTLDFRSRNHHDERDPWRGFDKLVNAGTSVLGEVTEAAQFLAQAHRPWLESLVVCSNHDMALERWLKESDFRLDVGNAPFFLRANLAAFEAMARGDKNFYTVEWAFRSTGVKLPKGIRFLRRDEDCIVCPTANDGIEVGMHGDKGSNGSFGSLLSFAKTGRKSITGHSHVAGIQDGAYQVGVMGALDQGYNVGQSSWSHTNAIVYPNGKRTLFTIWKGHWHG